MQDRFKFKWFSKKYKKIFEVTCLEFPDIVVYIDEDGNEVETSSSSDYGELIQSTGLRDKNGKLIYEGDIVETYKFTTGEISNRIVVWNEARCGCRLYTIENYKRNLHICPQSMVNVTTIEVIGNIYENPELLEE